MPRAQDGAKIVVAAAAAALLCQTTLLLGARVVSDHLSVRTLGREIAARIAVLDTKIKPRLICYDSYLHGLPFYTQRPADVVNWVGEMHYARRFKRFQHRFCDDNTIRL